MEPTDLIAADLDRVEKEIYNKGIADASEVISSRIENFKSMSMGIGPNAAFGQRLSDEHMATLRLVNDLIKA